MSTKQTTSILHELRAMVPQRPLTVGESYRIAELQANRLLAWGHIDEPGTPSELVSDLPFVHVALRADLPVSGSARWLKPRWLLLLNLSEPRVRRRFSLMHEFKHVLDDPFIDYLYAGRTAAERYRHAELVADSFAACLLMPKRLVKRLWGHGVQDPVELAERFSVSAVAMRYRLQQLGLADGYRRCADRTLPLFNRRQYYRRLSASPPLVATA